MTRLWRLQLRDGRRCLWLHPVPLTPAEFAQALPGLPLGYRVVAWRAYEVAA